MKLIKNQSGQAEDFFLMCLVLGGIIGAVMFIASVQSPHPHHSKRHHRPQIASVKMEKLKPVCAGNKCTGRYAFKDNKNVWWEYTFKMLETVADVGNADYASYGDTLPPNGTWSQTEDEVKPEEVEDEGQETISEETDGTPESAEDAASDASDSSSGGDSSDGGSGGGDGGGGDGGGD